MWSSPSTDCQIMFTLLQKVRAASLGVGHALILDTYSNTVTDNLGNSGQHCVRLGLEMSLFDLIFVWFYLLIITFQVEEASEAEELVMTSLDWVKDVDVNMQQAWERKLGVCNCFFETVV